MSAPKTLTDQESSQLIETLANHTGSMQGLLKSSRNCLMGLLMLDAGLRVGEVTQLLIDDLYIAGFARHTLLVREDIAKKKSMRIIPLSRRIRNFIAIVNDTYWSKLHDPTSGFAFYTNTNTEHLTTRQVERIIGNASEYAFRRRINPHVLRHTFGTNLMRTCNSRVVMELLGHKHLASTQIYTHPNHQDLKNAIDSLETNPQEKSERR
ncbi:Tyrosine recombinase XerC [subsurface metagenome]